MKIKSINPATEEVMKEIRTLTQPQTFKEIKKVNLASKNWADLDIKERCSFLKNISKIVKKNSKEYAKIITKEMGKPISQSILEIEKCGLVCDYYYKNAETFLSDEIIKTEAKKSYISFQPLGTILGIMPWNFPFWQVFRFAVPTLVAGNCVLVKHALNVPQCSLKIEEIFKEALPKNVFKNIFINHDVIKSVIENDLVDGVSLTGSVEAGKKIGELAGRNIKKVVLELGGNDPFIVLKDADIDFTCDIGVKSRFRNCGQSCIAAKRFIIHKDISEEFKDKFIDLTEKLIIGDPMDEKTNIGPLAREDLRINLERQIKQIIKAGGKILIGGKRLLRKGYFFEPTLIEAKKDNKIISNEEIFGPVANIIIAENDKELIKIANMTQFGLGASIWNKNIKKAEKLARKIEAGNVFINKLVSSDPRLPFGGVKKSGIGRELSEYGIKEFVNIKTIVVKK